MYFDPGRRSFIKGISLGTAGLALHSVGVVKKGNAAHASSDKSSVSFVTGTDVLAVDRMGAELMGIDYHDIGYLNYCADAGMGQIERSHITVIGKNPSDYVKKYTMHDRIEWQLNWKSDFDQQKR